MKIIDLKKLYPEMYKIHTELEVSDAVFNALEDFRRADEAMKKRRKRNHDQYSLDADDGIEVNTLVKMPTIEEQVEQRWLKEMIYTGLSSLPEKQAKRIYAYYLLGMSKSEIARSEGIAESSVRRSIELGIIKLKKFFEKNL